MIFFSISQKLITSQMAEWWMKWMQSACLENWIAAHMQWNETEKKGWQTINIYFLFALNRLKGQEKYMTDICPNK